MKVPNIKGLVSIARGMMDPQRVRDTEVKRSACQPDKVELSSQSQEVRKIALERTSAASRSELVSQLKSDYELGELSIDHQSIAEGMVADGLFDDIIAE